MLNLPIADFWIEADRKELPIRLLNETKFVNECLKSEYAHPYHIEESFIMIPQLPEKFYYEQLQVTSNIAAKKENFDDWSSDEFYDGALWIIGKYVIGLSAFVDNGDQDFNTFVNETTYPTYVEVNEFDRNKLIFLISYKKLDEYQAFSKRPTVDLSLDFALDVMADFVRNNDDIVQTNL